MCVYIYIYQLYISNIYIYIFEIDNEGFHKES